MVSAVLPSFRTVNACSRRGVAAVLIGPKLWRQQEPSGVSSLVVLMDTNSRPLETTLPPGSG